MPGGVNADTLFTKPADELAYIEQRASQLGVDPYVALSVVPHEGGILGEVGDHGTSFGPWQLHKGGALPDNIANPDAWSNSAGGIDYALRQIAKVTQGKKGHSAIEAMVRGFERPANPDAEIKASEQTYFRLQAYQKDIQSISLADWNKAAYGTDKVTNRSASDAGSYDLTDAGKDAGDLAKKALDPFGVWGKLAALLSWFTDPENWYRIALFGGGFVLVLGGIYTAFVR